MPTFAGINHIALTVRDPELSGRFYCDLLDFLVAISFDQGRVCIHRKTGFTIALLCPEGATDDRFSHLRTGLDHLGLAVGSRDELVAWEQRLLAAGVDCSSIQDLPLGHHLNFTDPDGIALELHAPTDLYRAALEELSSTTLSDEEVRARAAAMLGASLA